MGDLEDAGAGSDVFVSYAREDEAFVRRITEALAERGKKAWVDWADIPPTAEWMAEISAAIDGADTYLVVLSPDSLSSRVCATELEAALNDNKRIVPVLARDIEGHEIPEAVAKLNWVVFTDGFEAGIDKLIAALETDLESVKEHTRLLVRAREWEESSQDDAKLLRGGDLDRAEAWLAVPGSGVEPTQLQTAYVVASRRAATRRQRGRLAAVAGVLVLSLVLMSLALVQRNEASHQRDVARAAQHRAEQRAIESRSRELAADALEQLRLDPELSIMLAVQAVGTSPTSQAEDALRQVCGAIRCASSCRVIRTGSGEHVSHRTESKSRPPAGMEPLGYSTRRPVSNR